LTDNGSGTLNTGTLTMTDTTVSENEGYGILNSGEPATLTVTDSTLSGNPLAGIRNEGGQVTVVSSTLSSNGDGVFSQSHSLSQRNTLVVTNSTISGNAGVGIHSQLSETVVVYTTITGNGSWGIWNEGSDLVGRGPMTVAKSLVEDDCDGPITSDGYNIESPGDTCGFDQTGDQVSVTEEDLNLGPLANNSGPSMTHKPGAGGFGFDSAAIDKIPEAACYVDSDQRGQRRPSSLDPMCDVGSVEVGPEL